MSAELTEAEKELVSILLDLYNEAIIEQHANHEFGCNCKFCGILNDVGEYSYKLFDSLQTKTNQDQ